MSPLLIKFIDLRVIGKFTAHLIQPLHFVVLGQGIRVRKGLASPSKLAGRPTLHPRHWMVLGVRGHFAHFGRLPDTVTSYRLNSGLFPRSSFLAVLLTTCSPCCGRALQLGTAHAQILGVFSAQTCLPPMNRKLPEEA